MASNRRSLKLRSQTSKEDLNQSSDSLSKKSKGKSIKVKSGIRLSITKPKFDESEPVSSELQSINLPSLIREDNLFLTQNSRLSIKTDLIPSNRQLSFKRSNSKFSNESFMMINDPWERFKRLFRILIGRQKRVYKSIEVNFGPAATQDEKYGFTGNSVRTTKYNIVTWVPKSLLIQFFKAANIYFLIITVLTSLPFSPKKPDSQIMTFAFVLFFTMLKEAYEDFNRYKQDREVNNKDALTYSYVDKEFSPKLWREMEVGELVEVKKDEELPADLLLLKSSTPNGLAFVDTMNLDGETNLKDKVAIPVTHETPLSTILKKSGKLICDGPNESLDSWIGRLRLGNNAKRYDVDIHNLLLRGSTLRNTNWIIGLSVYCGTQSKIFKNSRKPPSKFSHVSKTMNKILYTVFAFQAFLCFSLATGSMLWDSGKRDGTWYLGDGEANSVAKFCQLIGVFLVAYSQLIPISLYVALEVLKLFQAYFISSDNDMFHEVSGKKARVKTSDIVEELGQIDILFSDKTGTLTTNEMKLRKCFISGEVYGGQVSTKRSSSSYNLDGDYSLYNEIRDETPKSKKIMNFFRLLSLCHSVVPDVNPDDPNIVVYQASSPDELALINGALDMGFKFLNRNGNLISLKIFDRLNETWNVLMEFPFDSIRKRMSVIVKSENSRNYLLLCKGADNVMLPRLKFKENQERYLTNILDGFAREGLRTLVMGSRFISPEDYQKIVANIENAKSQGTARELLLNDVYELVETEMKLVGATAIEDKLQDKVPETIARLIKAGIRVWMLTGDKQETAIEIAKSCKLVGSSELVILSSGNMEEFTTNVEAASAKFVPGNGKSYSLVINGSTLVFAFSTPESVSSFFALALLATSCICCRVSPKQKADVVSLAKKSGHFITAAVGDGTNDVSMILEAHIGIGIFGKEGTQAARSSDFAVAQFRFLQKLLLVHGRWSYKRISIFIYYYFYKNCTLVFTELFFSVVNGFSGQIYFAEWLPLLFNAFWTSWPCMANYSLEQDVDAKTSIKIAKLYRIGQKRIFFSLRKFWKWIAFSVWHGLCCFWIPVLIFSEPFDDSGLMLGHWMTSSLSFCLLMHVITFKLFLETYFWNSFNL